MKMEREKAVQRRHRRRLSALAETRRGEEDHYADVDEDDGDEEE